LYWREVNISNRNAKTGKTILVVEDNDAVRLSLAALLEIRGYNVLLASDGQAALEIASKSNDPIDLLITDIVMPKLNGVDMARLLQQRQSTMKVLFITGYNEEEALENFNLPPKANFIQKPSTMNELLQKISSLLTEEA
jgi:two-component system, cell cycle sensor histidine kinase and response regulator CckA